MDLSVIFQLRTKKFWWMDVILYFVISLFIATVFCWVIFLIENNVMREAIKKQEIDLQTVGTPQQKDEEKQVMDYQKKIADFTGLLEGHQFASNAFAFMQSQTMPNVWFKQFGLDEKGSTVQLSGESDSADALSRQVAVFEKNKYVKSIGTLNSSLGGAAKINFNVNLALDKSVFNYLADMSSILETTTPSDQALIQQGQQNQQGQETTAPKSSEKLITSFHVLLTPEVVGVLDETNYKVTLSVPDGTDVKSLTSAIVVSPAATVSPESGVAQDFTNPITYTVTAEDGSTQNYEVKVIVAAPPEANKKSNQSRIITAIITLIGIIVIAAIAVVVFLKKKAKT